MLLDSAGKIVVANETAAKLLGMTATEAIGRNIFDHTPARLAAERKKRLLEVFLSGKHLEFEDNQEGMHFSLVVYPVFNEQGKVERAAVFTQDITERKRAERLLEKARDELEEKVRERTAQLQETNEGLRAEISVRKRIEESLKTLSAQVHGQARMLDQILSSSPDYFYLLDQRGKFIYANATAAQMLGLKQSQMEGKYWWDLGLPEDAMRPLDIHREAVLSTGEPRSGRLVLPTPKGGKAFEYTLSPIRGWDGRVDTVVATLRDITGAGTAMDQPEHRATEGDID
jgi:PAS domain S-box-containing protein